MAVSAAAASVSSSIVNCDAYISDEEITKSTFVIFLVLMFFFSHQHKQKQQRASTTADVVVTSHHTIPHPVTMRQQHLYDKNVSHTLKAKRQKQECGNRSSATLQSECEGRKEWNGKEGGFRFSLPFCIHSKQPSASHTYSHFFKAILTFCSIYNGIDVVQREKREARNAHRFIMHRNMESSMAQSRNDRA